VTVGLPVVVLIKDGAGYMIDYDTTKQTLMMNNEVCILCCIILISRGHLLTFTDLCIVQTG